MKVTPEIIHILDRCTFAGNRLMLPEQLAPRLYATVAKVIEAAGGKWNRGAKAHLFEGDAAAAVEPVILTGEVISAKVEFDMFETPEPLARKVVALAGIKPGMLVLEPSAGKGALAIPAMQLGAEVHTCEILMPNCKVLAEAGLKHVTCMDFLRCDPAPLYHVVLMNPPFSHQADIDHVTHAARFLRPGGCLVAIMSAGVKFRQNRKAVQFRQLVEDHDGLIEPLPADSFKASGTGVSTVLVTFEADRDARPAKAMAA